MTDTSLSTAAPVIQVSVGGSPLPDDVQAAVFSIDVESSLTMPDSVVVMFHDPDHTVISSGGFDLGVTLDVSSNYGADSQSTLASGEITALEFDFGLMGAFTVVRALDKANRLFRGKATLAFQQMTASDAVSQVAQAAGLAIGQVDATDSTYAVLTQADQSDWEFIQQMARESNRVAYCQASQLYFVKPPDTSSAPETGDLGTPPQPLQLVLGVNLRRLHIGITAGEQVSSVQVRGWDPSQKQAIVGQGQAGTVTASITDTPDTIAGTFGGKTYVATDVPYMEQSEADAAAASLAERLSSAFIEVDGEATGMPQLLAGTAVSIARAGDQFDGKYVVTSARHVFDTENGYRTEFTVSGIRDATFGGLAGAAFPTKKRHLISGVVTATVSSVKDPNNSGMVQLTFPWLDDTYVSDWCRVLQPGAGASWGNILLPEVNAEVLVAFEQGDIRRPFVIGGLYNGQDTIAPQSDTSLVDSGTGAVNQRLYQSRTKHLLYFNDSASAGAVLLQSGDTNHSLKFDQSGSGTVTLQSNGDITVQGNNITITAQQNLQLEGQQQLTLKSPQIQVTADQSLSISSSGTASLTASGPLSISGATTSINS